VSSKVDFTQQQKKFCSSSVFRAFRRFCGTATLATLVSHYSSRFVVGVGPKRFISFFNGDDDDFDERKRDRGGTTLKRNWIMMMMMMMMMMTLMMPSSFCA
jgi:hypothetical protein